MSGPFADAHLVVGPRTSSNGLGNCRHTGKCGGFDIQVSAVLQKLVMRVGLGVCRCTARGLAVAKHSGAVQSP